ncbi:MAG: nitrate reductase cytochrome c-type subunit [Alphaproteobacteria bacterium]|nr:nitrate reductase cytochrome c-type subunit [Alphaproteobacteria bacterium]
MNRIIGTTLKTLAIAGLLAATIAPISATAQVQSLRGDNAIDADNVATAVPVLNEEGKRFNRAYRQQPPLIPHKVEKYQIDLKVNQCLRCHDWPRNVEENATKVSETHYLDRKGRMLDQVTRSRWFCTQCHVAQTKEKPLVSNSFQPIKRNR